MNFYDIKAEVFVTSTTGNIGKTELAVKNYTIGNATALQKLAEVVNSGNTLAGETIIQLADIGPINVYTPIGYWKGKQEEGPCFSGIYDGKDHFIRMSMVNNSNLTFWSAGIFGYVKGGTIKNLIGYGFYIEGSSTDNQGGIVGILTNSTIRNCKNKGNMSYGSSYTGGICGKAENSSIEKCVNEGIIKGRNYVGGIVGSYSGSSSIAKCSNKNGSTVTGERYVGGIVGMCEGNIEKSFNAGTISATGYNDSDNSVVGGIAGAFGLDNTIRMSDCYNVGNVKGARKYAGGLIGTCRKRDTDGQITRTIERCYI